MNEGQSKKFEFRNARADEADLVSRLVNSVYRGQTGLRSWTGEAHLIGGQRVDSERVDELIADPNGRLILAFYSHNHAPVGCVHIVRDEDKSCYLGMLTVDVDTQKAGLGSALLQQAELTAQRELGCQEMQMTVISMRTDLLQWYERRGYRAMGEKKPFPYGDTRYGIPYREDLEFVVLRKPIGAVK